MIECFGWTREKDMTAGAVPTRIAIDASFVGACFEYHDAEPNNNAKPLVVHTKQGAVLYVRMPFGEFVRTWGAEKRNYPA